VADTNKTTHYNYNEQHNTAYKKAVLSQRWPRDARYIIWVSWKPYHRI